MTGRLTAVALPALPEVELDAEPGGDVACDADVPPAVRPVAGDVDVDHAREQLGTDR